MKNANNFLICSMNVIDGQVSKVFINYKDRLSRVGFGLFKHLFLKFGTEIIVANGHANERLDSEEIMIH